MAEKGREEKERYEKRVEERLKEWREGIRAVEEGIKGLRGKAKETSEKALEEIKELMVSAQEGLKELTGKSGQAWVEGRENLNKVLDGIEKAYHELKERVEQGVGAAREEVDRLQQRLKTSPLWERIEKGLDEAWEASKKTAQWFSKEVGRATKKTRLTIENHRIQGQITKLLAQVGNEVYTKIVKEGKRSFAPTSEIRGLLNRVKALEEEMERNLEEIKKEG